MCEKRFELRQNSDGTWWLFNNENERCLMISKNFASLSDICIVLNQLSDSNEGLILDRNRQEEKLDIARRNLSKQLEKINEQQAEIERLKKPILKDNQETEVRECQFCGEFRTEYHEYEDYSWSAEDYCNAGHDLEDTDPNTCKDYWDND